MWGCDGEKGKGARVREQDNVRAKISKEAVTGTEVLSAEGVPYCLSPFQNAWCHCFNLTLCGCRKFKKRVRRCRNFEFL